MGKSNKRYKKESFSQKMREMNELEDLERSGYSDMISNNKRIKSKNRINTTNDHLYNEL